jgi:peptidoglycan biosynthesis protein MviN/MurJ (putative lipid II flippase)
MDEIPGPVLSAGNIAAALGLSGLIAAFNTLNDKDGRNAFPGKALNYFVCAFVLFLPTAGALFLWAVPWWSSLRGTETNTWLPILIGCVGAFVFAALARLALLRLPVLGSQLKLYERARADRLRRAIGVPPPKG